MVWAYRWQHRQELGDQYYLEMRQEFVRRVEVADGCCERNDWARVETRLALARLAHESKRYEEAQHWYEDAHNVLEQMEHPYKDVYLPLMKRQIDRCQREVQPEEGPILWEDRLMLPNSDEEF
jgi:hypothetical protein